MTATLTSWTRRRVAGVALAAASLAAVLGGCSVDGPSNAVPTAATAAATSGSPSITAAAAAGVRVVLRFGDHLATATLADTPAARQFAAMLPLTVELTDQMGQAKLGRLARPLDLTGADRVFGTTVGEITYWSPSDTLAIVYDGLGPTVPGPGLVRLGMVDTGLDDLADAGNRGSVRIDLAAEVNS
jgi:hypothetical protein